MTPAVRARIVAGALAGALLFGTPLVHLVPLGPLAPFVSLASLAMAAPVEVQVQAFSQAAVYPQREAAATVVPRQESRLSAELTATVVELRLEAGQRVARGDLLVRLDDADYRLALDRAQAQREAAAVRLALALRQLDRTRELIQGRFVSPELLNQRETEVASLRAELQVLEVQVATAQRQLEKTVIRAPFDGAVRDRQAQLGELAVPGMPLATLVTLQDSEIAARIGAGDADWIGLAREMVFEWTGEQRPVRLLRLSPLTDRESRTREARFALAPVAAQPAGAGARASRPVPLSPGAEGRLLWRDPRPHLPPEILVRRGDAIGAFIEVDAIARFVPLPGAQEGRPAVAVLPANAQVVVRGQTALREGTALRPSPAAGR